MDPIRVVLVAMPALIREIVTETLSAHGEVVLAEELSAIADMDVDVVLVAADDLDIPNSWGETLEAHPDAALIAIAGHGRRALVCEVVDEIGMDWLAEAVRNRRRQNRRGDPMPIDTEPTTTPSENGSPCLT